MNVQLEVVDVWAIIGNWCTGGVDGDFVRE